ncbi:cytochrome c biogenesis protein CcdA [Methanomicrobium sp. W14]|uniref:cytochrome c biogenesis protein CcdA n=1 Tax=Methanomicrobium sp. W14 TaxID=2817839 RepID=UPI001AE5F5DE|nr:cytochrome c biogenesis protein CcdA [Methanomicrobium sp. W14]MBP2134394.1 cytochrome c biogenesis protein CcdA [Methanomicrobium sp. W14]
MISKVLLAVFVLSAAVFQVYAGDSLKGQDCLKNDDNFTFSNTSVYFFYGSHCSACHRTMPVIKEAAEKYPDLTVYYYDVELSDENLTIFYDFADKYGLSYPGYPIIYTGDTVALEGYSEINSNITEVFEGLKEGLIPDLSYEKRWKKEPEDNSTGYALPDEKNGENGHYLDAGLVCLAGLLDGINPCAFAVLIFLLISLNKAGSKKFVILTGFSYIAGVYIIYILAGLGIMSAVSVSGFAGPFSVAAGLIAVVAGIISLYEGISEKAAVSLRVPEFTKGIIAERAKKATVPGAFVLGILAGGFELPCTGGIYLAVLGLLSSSVAFGRGFLYLVLYNLMFVLPLAAIVLLVSFGTTSLAADLFRKKNRRVLRFIMGAVLLLIGFFAFFEGLTPYM